MWFNSTFLSLEDTVVEVLISKLPVMIIVTEDIFCPNIFLGSMTESQVTYFLKTNSFLSSLFLIKSICFNNKLNIF